ncbi:zinc finger and SCAN domain-containing protein 29-like isoform X3 [Gymnodraco acuticeps]|uniref:Zinc finger and SCAN domain-containing protein 29-like isoform X3 n=1 Tax=Gymnodraco acuticeps TaxID=8218 RepID=A0A6P8WF72_GYMAC|nr:zinc finger and SCAN domain-containing protein 29-like isoform X3 [Gymnodraco acuticeps]
MATSKKSTPWSTEEVTTFLNLIGDDKIQQELDGTMRNVKVFQDVSAQMSERGFSRTFLQCREKLKKMKSEYRQVKDNNNTSGAGRKQWKWFDLSDQIYGHRPANVGREGGLDSATALLESLQDDYIGTSEEEHSRTTGDGSVPSTTSSSNPERTPARPQTPAEESTPTQPPTPSAITTPQRVVLGKRKRGGEDRAQQERHHEQHMAQQERHLDWAKASAERRWELDAVLRREEAAQAETFNLAFLRTLGEVLGGLGSRRGSRRGPSPP